MGNAIVSELLKVAHLLNFRMSIKLSLECLRILNKFKNTSKKILFNYSILHQSTRRRQNNFYPYYNFFYKLSISSKSTITNLLNIDPKFPPCLSCYI